MRKNLFLFLMGLLAGVGLFITYENLPIFIVLLLSLLLVFLASKRKSSLGYILVGLGLAFSICSITLKKERISIKNIDKCQLTILEKRKEDDSFRYFVRINKGKFSYKSLLFLDYDLKIGDEFYSDIKIKEPKTNTNPNLFSYRKYLASKKIFSQIEIDKPNKVYRGAKLTLRLRNSFYEYVHRIFDNNLSNRASDFVISVILGENLIENTDIKDLGLSHILAVSGLHIDLLVAFILFIFARLDINYKYAYGLALILAIIYGYLISFPFSILRVIGLNLIGFMAFLLKRPFDKIKALLLLSSLILLVNPFAVFNAGFILSFAASFGVYLIYPKFKKKLGKSYTKESFAFTSSIQLGLSPFIIYYYGRINLLSILANFLILPIFTLCMYIIFALVFFYPLLGKILRLFFAILDFLVNSILNITILLNKVGIFKFDFEKPSMILAIYAFLLIIFILNTNKRDLKKKANIFLLSSVLILVSLINESGKISYQMIDIGQGDAFMINDGRDYYLIDVGGPKDKFYDSGEKILLPYLKSLGVRKIKAIFISHEDKDHMGNLDMIYDNFKVEKLYTDKYNLKSLKKYKPIILKKGDSLKFKSVIFSCIFDGDNSCENASSLGLLIDIKGIKILSLGDLPSEFEDKLDTKADILKLSHHGSKTSSSRDFIEKVDPKIVLISAGRNNTYGHPHKEVLENVYDRKIYNTQTDGLVKMDFKRRFKIEKFLKGGYFRWIIWNLWKNL